MNNKKRLFIFDMDGTLLPFSTGLIELAKIFNTEDQLHSMEKLYSSRRLSTREFTYSVGQLWGTISQSDSRRAFDSARKIEGIVDCLKDIRDSGHVSCLITMSQDVFAQYFKHFGFDYVESTTYPPNTVGPIKILEPCDKVVIAQDICVRHNLEYINSVAFGDSLSDEPLFSTLELTVAVNATPELSNISKYSYRGTSILEAYNTIKTCL